MSLLNIHPSNEDGTPLKEKQVCGRNHAADETPSEKKTTPKKCCNQLNIADETIKSMHEGGKNYRASKNDNKNNLLSVLSEMEINSNEAADDNDYQNLVAQANICITQSPIEIPSDTESCPFLETETVCFFENLPPLTFPPYAQCQRCGRRFDDTDFEQHAIICCQKYHLPPTPQIEEQRFICCHQNCYPLTPQMGPNVKFRPTRIVPKYQPPFILKDIKPSCVDICDCIKSDEDE